MFKEKTCCKQCIQVNIKGNITKWPVQKQTLTKARYTQNNETSQTCRINYFVDVWGTNKQVIHTIFD